MYEIRQIIAGRPLCAISEERPRRTRWYELRQANISQRGSMYTFDPLEYPIRLSSARRGVPFCVVAPARPFAMLVSIFARTENGE